VGYRVRDLSTGEERSLCLDKPPGIPFRRFFFSPDGLVFANALLEQAAREAEVIVVDEVGPLELSSGGFAPGLRALLCAPAFLVLTVRSSLVDEVRSWGGVASAPAIALAPPLGTGRSLEETHRLFESWAATYDPLTASSGPLTGYHDSLARAAELVSTRLGERVLDIGIGTGAFAARVAPLGTEVWGVDLSSAMLARCREEHPDYHLREGHFLSLSVPDATFHVVVSSFAFHHLMPVEYESAFREILRVLVPGGRFVLLDVMFSTEADREAARLALGHLWDGEEVYPLVSAVEQAADRAGAADVAAHRVSWLHWAVVGSRPGSEPS